MRGLPRPLRFGCCDCHVPAGRSVITLSFHEDVVTVAPSADKAPDRVTATNRVAARPSAPRPLVIIAIGLFGAQFLGLLGFAAFIYQRFTLGIDFAAYGQGISQISHGNLNPELTVLNWPYVQNDFELISWPLGMLYFVFRSLFVLSFVQVACLCLTGFVTWRWVAEMVETRRVSSRVRTAILIGVLILLLVDPTVYFSTAVDFHFEAIATLFAVLSARSLWRGRPPKAAAWAVGALLCGSLGGLYVAGVGLSGVLNGRRTRQPGAILLAAGVVWIGLIGSLGASKGSLINDYAYLAGRSTLPAGFAGAILLLEGITLHLGRAIHHLTSTSCSHLIVRYLAWGGFFGFFTPWGFGVPALILLTSGLQRTTLFLGERFQQRAVVPFVLFGTASLAATLSEFAAARNGRLAHARRGPARRAGPAVAVVVALVVLVGSVIAGSQRLRASFTYNAVGGFIPDSEAAALRHILARTPSGAEVIVSLPISGRFADRKYLYLYDSPSSAIPIKANVVVLVLDHAHTLQIATPTQDAAAIAYAQNHFGARIIGVGDDVEAVEWQSPLPRHKVVLP